MYVSVSGQHLFTGLILHMFIQSHTHTEYDEEPDVVAVCVSWLLVCTGH